MDKYKLTAADFESLAVTDWLPGGLPSACKESKFPADMVGATIVAFGAPDDVDLFEGGGLIIDYRPPGRSNETRRLVLGFNECAMWVEYPKGVR